MLGIIRSITFNYSTLGCMFLLYFTSVSSKVEYASVVWNSITSTDANKLERILQKFTALCFKRFFPQVDYCYDFGLEQLKLHTLQKRRYHHDALFLIQVYRGSVLCLLLWKLLAFGSLFDILEILLCSMSVLLVKIAPLPDALLLLMLSVGTLTSLDQKLFWWSISYNELIKQFYHFLIISLLLFYFSLQITHRFMLMK